MSRRREGNDVTDYAAISLSFAALCILNVLSEELDTTNANHQGIAVRLLVDRFSSEAGKNQRSFVRLPTTLSTQQRRHDGAKRFFASCRQIDGRTNGHQGQSCYISICVVDDAAHHSGAQSTWSDPFRSSNQYVALVVCGRYLATAAAAKPTTVRTLNETR